MRSTIATKAPSSNGDGTSKITHQTQVAAPAMTEVATLPATVGTDLGEDLIADEDHSRSWRARHQPVQGGADARHVRQQNRGLTQATTPRFDRAPNTTVPALTTPENADPAEPLIVSVSRC
jgi:hypothetical protein